MGLSYELGVFDNIDELVAEGAEVTRPEYKDFSWELSANIWRMLWILTRSRPSLCATV